MANLSREFVQAVAKSIWQIALPGAAGVADAVGVAADRLIPRSERRVIDRMAKRVAAEVRLRAQRERNRGSAASAAYDVLSTIQRGTLDLDRLIKLDVSPPRVAQWLIDTHPAEHIDKAGPERQRNYEEAIQAYATRVVHAAVSLPGARARILSELLSRQSVLLARGNSDGIAPN